MDSITEKGQSVILTPESFLNSWRPNNDLCIPSELKPGQMGEVCLSNLTTTGNGIGSERPMVFLQRLTRGVPGLETRVFYPKRLGQGQRTKEMRLLVSPDVKVISVAGSTDLEAIMRGDNKAIANLLNGGEPCWVEIPKGDGEEEIESFLLFTTTAQKDNRQVKLVVAIREGLGIIRGVRYVSEENKFGEEDMIIENTDGEVVEGIYQKIIQNPQSKLTVKLYLPEVSSG